MIELDRSVQRSVQGFWVPLPSKVEASSDRRCVNAKTPRQLLGWAAFLIERVATTYSRGTYRTTTIGNAVFDGRVRDGIGSGHSFMVTVNFKIE